MHSLVSLSVSDIYHVSSPLHFSVSYSSAISWTKAQSKHKLHHMSKIIFVSSTKPLSGMFSLFVQETKAVCYQCCTICWVHRAFFIYCLTANVLCSTSTWTRDVLIAWEAVPDSSKEICLCRKQARSTTVTSRSDVMGQWMQTIESWRSELWNRSLLGWTTTFRDIESMPD